jgi:hypothetical protein
MNVESNLRTRPLSCAGRPPAIGLCWLSFPGAPLWLSSVVAHVQRYFHYRRSGQKVAIIAGGWHVALIVIVWRTGVSA